MDRDLDRHDQTISRGRWIETLVSAREPRVAESVFEMAIRPVEAPKRDDRPVLLYFASPRSGPCRRMEAFVDQVLQSRRNHDTFRRRTVDVDSRPELAERFEVRRLPTILVIDHGRVAQRVEGKVGVPQLRDALSHWLR
jgi:thioredoxin-like negative regulator of GroEL